jgi:hypothetical protein
MRPSQNKGIDIKKKESIITNISVNEFCRTAAATPAGIAISIANEVPKNTKRNVKG